MWTLIQNYFKKTICFEHVTQSRKWNAFHPCGHQSCSACFKNICVGEDGNKLCPICRAEITMSLALEVICINLLVINAFLNAGGPVIGKSATNVDMIGYD